MYLKIKLHTESVKVGAPLFHPSLLGLLTPGEVLQNKSTAEFHSLCHLYSRIPTTHF